MYLLKTPPEHRVGEVLTIYYHLNNDIEKSVHLFNLYFQPVIKFSNPYPILM